MGGAGGEGGAGGAGGAGSEEEIEKERVREKKEAEREFSRHVKVDVKEVERKKGKVEYPNTRNLFRGLLMTSVQI